MQKESESCKMTNEHLRLLRINRAELVDLMEPADVINKLVSRGALPEKRILEEINSKVIRQEKVECLLDKLVNRPDSAFEDLVVALESTNQHHLSGLLRQSSGKKIKCRLVYQ